METVKHEIREAVRTLGFGTAEFRELSDEEAKPIYLSALNHFVDGGERRWWWEAFNQPSVAQQLENGWTLLPELVPDLRSTVWFIPEETRLPFYPVYEATPEAISSVIGECYGFEYYLLAKDMSWLICENHHDWLIAVGEPVRSRFAKIAYGPSGNAPAIDWFEDYTSRLDKQPAHLPMRCPCCGYKTLEERGMYDICPVCFWEDDGQDDHDADVVRGGPNGKLSLTQARVHFKQFGACEERFRENVRAPRPEEMP